MRPLWPEIKVDLDNIEGSRGTSHTSKDGPICSGKFPATPNELQPRHQANLPVSFKGLSVHHNYTKCSRQQNKSNNVNAEIMWTT